MKSAWVITQEGSRHKTKVIGIISARKSDKDIKKYVEWLYMLLHCYPRQHLDSAKYTKPSIDYKAKYLTTNTGTAVNTTMFCGDNPWLVARLANDLICLDIDGEEPVLTWTNPGRIVSDAQDPRKIERMPGIPCKAPIHLPLRITPIPSGSR
jgi:hypothetical protein